MNFKGIIQGLHHVTATVNDAQEDYDFYTKTLGMRLIKETVNFDNEKVYHFYYGNEIGLPSTVFTTFPYKGQDVKIGTIGAGQVYQTSFSVAAGALYFWKERLREAQIAVQERQRFGTTVLEFKDPSGLRLDIVEAEDDRKPIWATDDIKPENAIIGIHNVTMLLKDADSTIKFMETFGYTVVQSESDLTLMEAGEGGAGNSIIIKADADAKRGVNGIGTVHHVAHRVASIENSKKIKAFMEEQGLKVTEVKDRKYFRSIYFRIPGGVLFEVATEGPGFMVDEDREQLGSSLKLPDWQEPKRKKIEANLPPYNR